MVYEILEISIPFIEISHRNAFLCVPVADYSSVSFLLFLLYLLLIFAQFLLFAQFFLFFLFVIGIVATDRGRLAGFLIIRVFGVFGLFRVEDARIDFDMAVRPKVRRCREAVGEVVGK